MASTREAAPRGAAGGSFSQARIPELDGLRGLAILLVLLYHYVTLSGGAAPGTPLYAFQQCFAIGWAGVDLFFVLSGFLIGGILLESRESPLYYQTFYARRFFRIIPLYGLWVAMFFVLVLLSFPGFPALIADNPEQWSDARFYFSFLQNSFKIPHGTFGTAWLGALWSLAVEEQFYLVMPLAVRLVSRRRLVHLLCLTIAMAPVLRMAVRAYVPQHGAAAYVLTACRADALAIGVLLACVLRDAQWRSRLLRCAKLAYAVFPLFLIGGGYIVLAHLSQYSSAMSLWGFSFLGIFFVSLLALAVVHPQGSWAWFCRWPFLAQLGRVSYCVYVIHETVNLLVHLLTRGAVPAFNSVPSIAVTLLAAVLTFAIAQLSWKFFEYPLLRKGYGFKYTPPEKAPRAGVPVPSSL